MSKARALRLISSLKKSELRKSLCGQRIIRTLEAQYRKR